MWFIVALVYFSSETQIARMQDPFMTKEICQSFYQSNLAVRDDIIKLYPQQTGHALVCLTEEQIKELIVDPENNQGQPI